ncbi:MAG: carboxymuconolactone decarboxylase family protein [Nonomuraea sp.]|nr:carboxymuconolactone decarboxylase family protein [Nonomuraea sp.]
MSARLPGLPPEDLDEEQAEVYRAIAGGPRASGPFPLADERGVLRGPFNAMLLSPPVGGALQALGAAVRYGTMLSDRIRELAILVVAAHWGSDFERAAHEAVGRTCGLTEAELTALREGRPPDLDDPAERAAVHVARELAGAGTLSDDDYARVTAAVGERGLFELTTLVGYYATLALQLRVFQGEGPRSAPGQGG